MVIFFLKGISSLLAEKIKAQNYSCGRQKRKKEVDMNEGILPKKIEGGQ